MDNRFLCLIPPSLGNISKMVFLLAYLFGSDQFKWFTMVNKVHFTMKNILIFSIR